MIQIQKKIKSYSVHTADKSARKPQAASPAAEAPLKGEVHAGSAQIVQMHESVERPEVLIGETYKIKSPMYEHAIYVTVNDMVLNAGTEFEVRRPFEVFVNSKNMDHFQWIVALTRVMSAVFRKGGDVTFLVEELKAVFDPRGGYWKPGGVFVPSLVADLGNIIEQHMKMIGLIKAADLSDAQKALIAEKRAAFEKHDHAEAAHDETSTGEFPEHATMCNKCNTKAVVMMDNCATCLSCGYSKCGT